MCIQKGYILVLTRRPLRQKTYLKKNVHRQLEFFPHETREQLRHPASDAQELTELHVRKRLRRPLASTVWLTLYGQQYMANTIWPTLRRPLANTIWPTLRHPLPNTTWPRLYGQHFMANTILPTLYGQHYIANTIWPTLHPGVASDAVRFNTLKNGSIYTVPRSTAD